MNEDEKKDSKVKVRKEVGYPTGKSENSEVHSDTKQKAEKAETKAKKTKKTEE
ncbi:hypothetical protein LDL59_14545 [Kaistella anthropi]|nr:hypothetical protein [Kaistella anthropi]